MESFRFIHTGDIHLDSPLRGLSRLEGPTAERIRTATRSAFDNLVTEAIEERVAFVVIAGDLYDGDWRDYHTGLFFIRQMGRLAAANIPAFVLYGNHDAESQITRRLVLPPNVREFSARKPQTHTIDRYRVALHGQSFRQRDITENLAAGYPAPLDGYFNIGVLHTALDGVEGHANYAPCTIDDLLGKGYQYWALAHVHQAAVLHTRPHIVFCGNLQGRHIRETGAKGAQLVTVTEGAIDDMAELSADVVRWAHLAVTVTGCSRLGDVVDRMRSSLEDAVRDADGRLIACRVELTGTTALHAELQASASQLAAEARAAALALGNDCAWIERVVLATKSEAASASRQDDALSDLQIMIADAVADPALHELLAADIGEFVRRLPHGLGSGSDDPLLTSAAQRDFAGLIRGAGDYLTARLATNKA